MVPGVLVLPLLSVFINVFLILKLSYLKWIRFGFWMVTGECNFVVTLLIWSIEFRYNNDIFYQLSKVMCRSIETTTPHHPPPDFPVNTLENNPLFVPAKQGI